MKQKIYVFSHCAIKKPSGGLKIHFELAQALLDNGYDACVLIPGKNLYPADNPSDYKPNWFETSVEVMDDVDIITSNDIVVIHEEGVWAYEYLKANSPKMIMLNQGLQASLIDNVGKVITYNYVKNVYDNCIGAIAVSPYIKKAIHSIFGMPSDRVFFIDNYVDSYFVPLNKENNILVMSKQEYNLATEMILKIARERYSNWSIEIVNNYSHLQLANRMGHSKIFCFFDRSIWGEGSSLPPIEAALSGCKVIGYSGVGSSYYYDEPIFTEIKHNDVSGFINALDTSTKLLEKYRNTIYTPFIDELRNKRSKQNYTNAVGKVFEQLLRHI